MKSHAELIITVILKEGAVRFLTEIFRHNKTLFSYLIKGRRDFLIRFSGKLSFQMTCYQFFRFLDLFFLLADCPKVRNTAINFSKDLTLKTDYVARAVV